MTTTVIIVIRTMIVIHKAIPYEKYNEKKFI